MRARIGSALQAIREGRLTDAQRNYIVAALMLALVVTGYVDLRDPNLKLAPASILFVISIAGVGGLVPGLIGALFAAVLFSLAESGGASGSVQAVAAHVLLRSASYFLAAGLVELIRRQAAALSRNEGRLHEMEFAHTKDQLDVAQARIRAVGESVPFGVWYANAEGRLVYMSDSFLNLVGLTLDEVRSHGWLDHVRPEDGERIRRSWEQRQAWTGDWEDEYHLRSVDGTDYTILCRGRAVRDENGDIVGWAGINLDVTESVKARERLRFLADAGRVLALSLDPMATLERVAGLIVPRLADWCEIHLLQDNGDITTAFAMHADLSKAVLAQALRQVTRRSDDPSRVATVIRTGTSVVLSRIDDALLVEVAQNPRHLEILRDLAGRSALVVPLKTPERVFGAMTLVQTDSGRAFTEDDRGFIEILAARAALAYENARNYAREHRVASVLQRASLPTVLPHLPGIRVQAAYLPGASESEIGGDWYDAFLLQDGSLGISIGDVAGKGLRAAVAMSSARQALRSAALEGSSPAEVLRRANLLLEHEGMGMVTAAFGILDPVTLQFTFASAGHPPPLLATAGGDVQALTGGGLPLGLFGDQEYTVQTARLAPGSVLVLYTDGLIECERNIIGGEAQLTEAVRQEALSGSPDPAQGIIRRVIRDKSNDDVALITVSVSSVPLDRVELVVDATPASARVLRQALRRLALSAGLDEMATMDLLVASGEAISNVIEHAYGVDEGELRLRAFRQDGEISVEIKDRGRWRERSNDRGGRGLPLMRALMTDVNIASTEDGTTVVLRKSLREDI
jgi:PAS domain S-box-containing protein